MSNGQEAIFFLSCTIIRRLAIQEHKKVKGHGQNMSSETIGQ